MQRALAAIISIAVLTVGCAMAQAPEQGAGAAPTPNAQAQAVMQAVRNGISAEHIRQVDEKLVSFGTRNTLSSMDEEMYKQGKGIKAAREWIRDELQRYSDACGNCMKVEIVNYVQQPASRIPNATDIGDVYAMLPGTDPVEAKHIYLVTGHYDTRNSDTLDYKGDAPGANDDTSGTAVSMECARVLSQHRFPATLVFLTVAGEEQGLNGSDYFAKWAKQQGWDIVAVLNNDIVGGNRTPGDTLQRNDTLRVFSESIPINATEQQVRMIRAIGAES